MAGDDKALATATESLGWPDKAIGPMGQVNSQAMAGCGNVMVLRWDFYLYFLETVERATTR